MSNIDGSTIFDTQAEAVVLASVISHPEFLPHLEFLQPNQFYNTDNACMWWSCNELLKQGISNIDAINLSNSINSNNAVRKKISEYNIVDLQAFIDNSQYAARHSLEEVKALAKTITTLAYKRDLNRAAIQIQKQCFDDNLNLSSLNHIVTDSIDKLNEKYIISDELQSYGEKVDDLWQQIVDRRSETGLSGIPFKFPTLNEYVTLEKTELVVLAARMKKGKSGLMMDQAMFCLKNHIPTFYGDTEMGDRLFHERVLANLTGVPIKAIKSGFYSYEDGQKLAKANEWLKNQPFYHVYLPNHTNEELYSLHKVLKNKIGLELSIFDYIKSNVTSTSENYNILGEKVDFLKNDICGRLDIAMLSAVQLNRNNEVADSDKINRHLSALLLWEEKTNEEINRDGAECGNYKIKVELNRLGEQMGEDEYIDIKFNPNIMRAEEAKQHSANNENTDPFFNEEEE